MVRKLGCTRIPLQAEQCTVRIQPINTSASPVLRDRIESNSWGQKKATGREIFASVVSRCAPYLSRKG